MAGKIHMPEMTLSNPVDPAVAEALRLVVTGVKAVQAASESDVVTFLSTGSVETLSHRLGRLPRYFRIIKKDGTADLYATAPNFALWSANRVVITSTVSGTNFTIEVF